MIEENIEREIDNKKVIIKIIKQLHGAWAGGDGKTIILNEKTTKSFNKKELKSILYHEVEHLKFFNRLLAFLPILLIFLESSYIIYRSGFSVLIIIVSLVIYLIIRMLIAWIREILCDWNAVKNTEGDIFRKTLQEFYRYNKENSKPSLKRFYDAVILHPPQPIRLRIIKCLEKKRHKLIKLNRKFASKFQ